MQWSGVVALATIVCVLFVAGVGGTAAPGVDEHHVVAGPSGTTPTSIGDAAETAAPSVPLDSAETATSPSVTSTASDPPFAGLADEEFDSTEFRIRVHADGDAMWRFEFRRVLETDEDREQFDAFAEEFRETETEFYQSFEQQARDLVTAGEAVTDRQMEAQSFERSAERRDQLGNEFGVVEIEFRWTNLAQAADDDSVTMGDVFQGTMFISESQRLVVETGDGLVFEEVQPEGVTSGSTLRESSTVTWEGDREFLDGRPRAVLVPTDGRTETTSGAGGISPMWAALALAVVAAIVGGGFALYQRGGVRPDESPPEPGQDPSASSSGTGAAADDTTAEPISDTELLTDEDRVVQLLEERGGRMKQVEIVEETEWSKSKVSMLLSDMEEEGTLTKIRVGRENIVALAGHEPDAVGSPFDDE